MTYRTAVLVLAIAACGDNKSGDDAAGPPVIPDACNPLGGQGCLLPWPSMSYTKADPSSATGFRLDLPIEGMPANDGGLAIDPAPLNARWDGFSPTAPMIAMFPHGVSATGLPSFQDPGASLAADSPVVVLDLDTGERAPVFAEVDDNVDDPDDRALLIRPLMRLHEKAHYAVAIRNTVKSADGSDLPVSAGFAALRDGTSFAHPRFADLAARSSDLFAKLAAAGVARSDLVLAWDFVTASDDMLRADLTAMRSDALAAIGDRGAGLVTTAGGPVFTVTDQPNTDQSYKRYLGTFKSPDFLTAGETDPSILRRDAAGRPLMQGLRDANLAAIIPACVATQPLPRPTIIFGHGLFGSAAGYLSDPFVQSLAEDHCLIILAGDFIGLTDRQLGTAGVAVTDLNRGATVTEKLAQSIIDFMALESIARGPMASAPEFSYNGAPVIDRANTFYVGGSLGGIMGNVLMAYDPNLIRGVLAVPGGAWSMLIERSNAWSILKAVIQGAYPDDRVYALNVALFGMAFEPYDPITTAAHVIQDPLFGNPVKHILMWYSIGDCLVSNITTEMVARTMGIHMIGPTVKMPWQVPIDTGPQPNGIVVLDDHPTPLPPDTNVPPAKDNGTHSGINRKAAALRMVENFLLAPQQAIDGCALAASPTTPAPCDCATGACD
ncbi:MAG TPA: hypothetical protein VH165_04640 [Kofleriaceae bacterium]|jgi:hypothetical protein|nr:hypothetical protein [Kofleriaceae bacterium]